MTTRTGGFSAAFDEQFERNAAELDALLDAGPEGLRRTGSKTQRDNAGRAATIAHRHQPEPKTRSVTDRNGNEWTFELVESQREDDEMVVTGRLTQTITSHSVNATGRAPVRTAATTATLAGTVDGIPFSAGFGSERESAGSRSTDEAAAVQQATEQAVENCARWI